MEFKSLELESLAREIVAFANSSGGTILIGVEDSGKIKNQTETWFANIVRNNVIPAIASSQRIYPIKRCWQSKFPVVISPIKH